MKTHSLSWKRFGRVVFSLIILIILLPTSDKVGAQPLFDLSVSIDPSSGPSGTSVTMSGSGWTGNTSGHEIHWDSKTGSILGTFSTNPNGAFTTTFKIPSGASPGQHTLWVCDRCHSVILLMPTIWKSINFTVIAPATPTPTRVPPTPTPTDVPTVCDALGIPGEVVIDFEGFSSSVIEPGAEIYPGIMYQGDLRAQLILPDVATKSFSHALVNSEMMEFASINDPLRFGFAYLQDFVGVYVGLNNPRWADRPISATMTARGYPCDPDEEGHFACAPGIVGTDSVSFGPEPAPVKECLSVEAQNIFEVTIDYGPAADPEIIDNLTLRGPEEPEPIPEDDRPPIVTIELPESGVVQPTNQVRLQGEVREDRELAQLRYRVNSGSFHEVGFTSAGLTPEGERLYLFAVDPLPVEDIRTCGDNLVEVVAVDTSENEAMGLTAFPVYFGDLSITSIEPVQVVYGADLVMGKGTAFRVEVNSTYTCQVQAKFLLDLPKGEWDTTVPTTGSVLPAVPSDWEYPEIWGPVPIPPNADNYEVMLPYIEPGQEDTSFSSSNPAGLIKDRTSGYLKRPDVRVVPRPMMDTVSFAVEIDPQDSWPETDEGNNRLSSSWYRVITTRSVCFYIVPVHSNGRGPQAQKFNIQEQIEFLLALYPLADEKVTWRLAPVTAEPCPAYLSGDCDWAITDEGDFLSTATTMAMGIGCDYAIAIGPWGGGSTPPGYTGGACLGNERRQEVLSHEFNHSMTGVLDMYSLDCMVDWDEFYCEFSDGSRTYYCQDDPHPLWGKSEGYTGLNCYCSSSISGITPCSFDEVICEEESKTCEMYTGCSEYRRTDLCMPTSVPAYSRNAVEPTVVADCSQETGYWAGPDCRIRHDTSEGFWVNHWESQPAGQTYIMDCAAGRMWMRLENCVNHCVEGQVFNDGYRNMLSNENFVTGDDPEALLVRGVIHRDGTVELDPFMYFPQANLDRAPGAAGEYQFLLLNDQSEILSQTGFEVTFEGSGIEAGPKDSAAFVMRIEWKSGTRKVLLVDNNGRELAAVRITPNAPEVEITNPAGAATYALGRSVTVRWEAMDEDGDALTYFVDLSPDGGENWFSLAVDLEDTEYRLDTNRFSAGSNYLIRVRASDGVNTAEDVSDAVFTLSDGSTQPLRNLILVGMVLLGLIGAGILAAGAVMFIRRRAQGS
jgi:hypothetical protein